MAARRWASWRAQPPFDDDALFARRLAADDLDPGRFRALLGESADSLVRRAGPPPWRAELEAAWADHANSAEPANPANPAEPKRAPADFTALLEPLKRRAHRRLAARVREHWGDDPTALFAPGLEAALEPLPARTLVLELHVARLRGELTGDTPEQRFGSFLRHLSRPEVAAALLDEYPVLARLAVTAADDWVAASAELLERLKADLPLLTRTLWDGEAPGPLAAVTTGLGDRHRGGRSVAKLTFASGRRVVYKPRPMTVDAAFQDLLPRFTPSLRTVGVVDRGEYGWMEHVDPAPCADRAGLERFHHRLGLLLPLLWALDATDLHFENLIAAGDQPVLVDLETLLHPRASESGMSRTARSRPDLWLAGRALDRSLIRVGLLPFPLAGPDGGPGLDLSGLAAVGGESPESVLLFRHGGTDAMRVVRETVTLEPGDNRPTLAGEPEATDLDALAFSADLLGGFRRGWQLLERHRDELAERLETFAPAPVRAVARATRAYGMLEQDGLHPDLLRDALDRDRFFGHLWYGLEDAVGGRPHLLPLVPEEHRQLARGDVPYFTARPDSTSVWVGDEEIPGVFDRPALGAARERLATMDEAERRFQAWILETSLAPLALGRPEVQWVSYDLPAVLPEPRGQEAPEGREALKAAARDRLRQVAARAGERLEERALTGGGDVTWIGLEPRREGYGLGPLGDDLYDGAPGVALYLAHLGAVSEERRWSDLARAAVGTLRARLAATGDEPRLVGAFEGWGGLAWVFTHLAALWDDRASREQAMGFLRRGAAALPGDRELDVVSGAAGLLAAALGHHVSLDPGSAGRDEALAVAVACGDHLLAAARSEPDDALSWLRRGSGIEPHTGFSHGAAGFGWALGILAGATGESRYRDAARRAFRFESRRFRSDLGNWIDPDDPAYRPGAAAVATPSVPAGGVVDRVTSMAWCYGAPGVGLARVAYLRAVPDDPADDAVRAELRQALDTTRARGFGFNHCLCHGDLGNADLLLQAGEEDAALDRGGRIATSILGAPNGAGPRFLCGTPTGVETPGLLNGVAGIGWGALRLAEPPRVPSVLTLEGPVRDGPSRSPGAGVSSSQR